MYLKRLTGDLQKMKNMISKKKKNQFESSDLGPILELYDMRQK